MLVPNGGEQDQCAMTGSERVRSVVCALVLCGKARMRCGLQVRARCSGSPRSRTAAGSEVVQHPDRSVSPVWFVICCSERPSSAHLVLPGDGLPQVEAPRSSSSEPGLNRSCPRWFGTLVWI
ncbi:hypothetical protein NL108_010971 [Boleophthalmus pectinirostris]|nr:hypothetical protein NL108_010971 [Boleophthalmus pectinirostris]